MSKAMKALLESIVEEELEELSKDKMLLKTNDPRLIEESERFQKFHKKLRREKDEKG